MRLLALRDRIIEDHFDGGGHQLLFSEARESPLARRFLHLRIVGALALAVFFLLAIPGDLGDPRRLAAMGVAIAFVPIILLIERHVCVVLRDVSHYVASSTMIIVAGAIAPSVWVTCNVLVICHSIVIVASWPNRFVYGLSVALLALNAGVGWLLDVPQSLSATLVALIFTTLIFGYFREWTTRRSQIDDRYERLVTASHIFFWELDIESGRIVELHGDVGGLTGWSRAELLGTKLSEHLLHPEDVDLTLLANMDDRFDAVLDTRMSNGDIVPLRHQIRRGTDTITGVASDYSDRQKTRDLLQYQASHDELTGLRNRHSILAGLDEALTTSDVEPVVYIVDIRRFAEVNTAFGFTSGDAVLREAAKRLSAAGIGKVVARVGATEFALVDPEQPHDPALFEATALDLAHRLSSVQVADGLEIGLEVAVGVAAGGPGSRADRLLGEAATALAVAKHDNSGVVFFGDIESPASTHRLRLAAEFETALDRGEFELWFQPKVAMPERRLVGVEGLARWRRRDGEVLLPEEFIDMIELSVHYERFTQAMMRQGMACAAETVSRWPNVEVAINVHPRSFANPDLVNSVCTLIDGYGLPRSCMKLEVTEVDRLLDFASAVDEATRLVDSGVGLSVDDFGTGYASLHRLRDLPVTEMKIDRIFVERALTRPEDRAIIEASVRLAATLEIACVAEGVETADSAELLLSLGCDHQQGYYFGAAMPHDALVDVLTNDTAREWSIEGLTVL